MKKFCTKCGHEFEATGREVICPSCKAQAAEENKRAAVLRAKKASWVGESVPVRISGRSSTVIRAYGKYHNLPFAEALDKLLQSTAFFNDLDVAWNEIKPYKSHRRDKHATETENTSTTETVQDTASKPQDGTQTAQGVTSKPQEVKPQEAPQEVKQAAKVASKTSTSMAAGKPQEVTKAAKVANKNTTSAAKKAVKTSKGGTKA